MSDQDPVDLVFDALGEPVRRRIIELLSQQPMPVGQLAERLPVGRPAVSKHLRLLADAGLVTVRPEGTRNFYGLAPGGIRAAQLWLSTAWDDVLSAFADHVAERSAQAPPSPTPPTTPTERTP